MMQVCYPKRTNKPLYQGLVTQLESLKLPFLDADDILHGEPLAQRFDVVLDAMFGFSFKGDPRPPFDTLLQVRDCTWALAASLAKAALCLMRAHTVHCKPMPLLSARLKILN